MNIQPGNETLIGVLGGMGPLATVDLLQKIIAETPVCRDQDHVPVVVWNVPQIPDRQQALAGTGVSPLPVLLAAIRQLNQLPLSHIVIPCNTAHHWFDALQAESRVPLIHIADATLASAVSLVQGQVQAPRKIGLIATTGTLDAGWYQQRFATLGAVTLTPNEQEMATLFVPGCYAVKRGELSKGGELLDQLAQRLVERGAEWLVLACTEVPPALTAVNSRWLDVSIDPTRALAQACVWEWRRSAAG
ncbi:MULTISPECIES: aspartate/glutamate racemase family protein [unclassified Brenneria]|uniref:aspartate/glutamate racemase family protein n=1 Tax=unclassified Brenneria TaxID=2634434 RepID=UPI001555C365|nr:amino acid racemase [Brenneria sp. hezel4-2-4]MEE3649820.1 amino acid racemase [Brenneria sp. HEZEL_4_2_4]NPC99779.1 aspartate/glutamate racemase family protein [Brenneria sp. hezel4-2-4]